MSLQLQTNEDEALPGPGGTSQAGSGECGLSAVISQATRKLNLYSCQRLYAILKLSKQISCKRDFLATGFALSFAMGLFTTSVRFGLLGMADSFLSRMQ